MLRPLPLPTTPLTVPLQRLTKETRIYNLLCDRGVNMVPLVGVYSTEAHPFCLVYEYMANLDLRQYLMNAPNVERLGLVFILMQFFYINSLTCPDNR